MDHSKWFKKFLQSYRAIIDKEYSDRKGFFPYYDPVDVSIYLVNDPRQIMPEVVVFFQKEMSQLPVSGIVTTSEKEIDWPEDFDDLRPSEQNIYAESVYFGSFSENQYPGIYIQEAFSSEIFSSKPRDQAKIMVQKHLVKGIQRESFKNFLKITKIRRKRLGNKGVRQFLSNLSGLPDYSDEETATIICQAFHLLGFETINLERLKQLNEYRKLNEAAHVDVLAFIVPHNILVAIEEGEMNKDRWYKKDTLSKTLDILDFLGKKEDWKTIIFLAIGRRSSGIDHLEGDVRVVSLDRFLKTMQDAFQENRYAALNAIRKILGYELQFFWG